MGSLPRKGLKEAGSLGEARQVPLSPVGNPAENNTIARPGEKSPRANIGSGKAGRSLRIGAVAIYQNPSDGYPIRRSGL